METKGERMITAIEKIREGLEMLTEIGDRQDLVKALLGSPAAAERLRDLVKGNGAFERLVLPLVRVRNGRLNTETVDKVVTDFLDVVFDLSRPYPGEDAHGDGA